MRGEIEPLMRLFTPVLNWFVPDKQLQMQEYIYPNHFLVKL